MAGNCSQCGAELTADDKFCGDCGLPADVNNASPAITAPAAMVPPPRPSEAEPTPPKAKRGGIVILGILAGMVLGGGAAVAGVGYYSGWFGSRTTTVDVAQPGKRIAKSDAKPAAETPIDETEAGEKTQEPDGPKEPKPESDGFVIEPGKWNFSSEVTSAVVQGTRDPAISHGRALAGGKGSGSRCVSKKLAKRPAGQNLMPWFGDCGDYKVKLQNGKFTGTTRCMLPPHGKPFTIRMVGNYDRKKITLQTFSTIQFDLGPAGNTSKGNAEMTTLITGRYAGTCS